MSEETKAGEKRLKLELDNVMATLADDLEKLNAGAEDTEFRILNRNESLYGRVINLLKFIEEAAPAKLSKKSEEPEAVVKKMNVQDAVLKKTAKKT